MFETSSTPGGSSRCERAQQKYIREWPAAKGDRNAAWSPLKLGRFQVSLGTPCISPLDTSLRFGAGILILACSLDQLCRYLPSDQTGCRLSILRLGPPSPQPFAPPASLGRPWANVETYWGAGDSSPFEVHPWGGGWLVRAGIWSPAGSAGEAVVYMTVEALGVVLSVQKVPSLYPYIIHIQT